MTPWPVSVARTAAWVPETFRLTREALRQLGVGVLDGRHGEGLLLARRAGEAERRRVLRIVRALRRRVVGEARRHRQPAGDGLVQRHRERHRVAFAGVRVVHRQRRRAVHDRAGPGNDRDRAPFPGVGPGDFELPDVEAHLEGLVLFQDGILRRSDPEGVRSLLGAERDRVGVRGVVGRAGGPVREDRLHGDAAGMQKAAERRRELQGITPPRPLHRTP